MTLWSLNEDVRKNICYHRTHCYMFNVFTWQDWQNMYTRQSKVKTGLSNVCLLRLVRTQMCSELIENWPWPVQKPETAGSNFVFDRMVWLMTILLVVAETVLRPNCVRSTGVVTVFTCIDSTSLWASLMLMFTDTKHRAKSRPWGVTVQILGQHAERCTHLRDGGKFLRICYF